MSLLGQSRHFDRLPDTSGLPQSTDIDRPAQLVRSVPRVDIREMKEFANWQDGRPPDCAM
jgi:hypothetical protein